MIAAANGDMSRPSHNTTDLMANVYFQLSAQQRFVG